MPPSLRDYGNDVERPSLRRPIEPPNPGKQALARLGQLQERLGNVLTIVDVQAVTHPLYGEEIPLEFKKRFRTFIEDLLAIQQRIEEIEGRLRSMIDTPSPALDEFAPLQPTDTAHPLSPSRLEGTPLAESSSDAVTPQKSSSVTTQTEMNTTRAEIDALKTELAAHEASFAAYKQSLPADASQQTADVQAYIDRMQRYLDEQRAHIDTLEQKQKGRQTEPV